MPKKIVTRYNAREVLPIIGAMIRDMLKAGKNVLVEFKEYKSKRSLAQNRLLWLWNQCIADHFREHRGQENSAKDVHEVFVRKKLGAKVIQVGDEDPITTRKLTRILETAEFSEYLNWLDQYCAEYLNLLLPRPDDLYWHAVYGTSGEANNVVNQ